MWTDHLNSKKIKFIPGPGGYLPTITFKDELKNKAKKPPGKL